MSRSAARSRWLAGPQREAGKLHDRAFHAAMTVSFEARREEKTDQIAVSEKVAVMISLAVSVDPEWFWKNIKTGDYWRQNWVYREYCGAARGSAQRAEPRISASMAPPIPRVVSQPFSG